MTTNRPSVASEDEVLEAFAAEHDHSRSVLEEYVTLYPQHAAALGQLAVEIAQQKNRREEAVSIDDPAVSKAWSAFSAIPAAPAAQTSPLSALNSQTFRAVAEELDITTLLLTRFRDRTIEVLTIPKKFVGRLGKALGIDVDALAAELALPSKVAASESYKADGKPTATAKISFKEAIETSGLSEQQKRALLDMME